MRKKPQSTLTIKDSSLKKKPKRVAPADIDNPGTQLLENALFLYNLGYKQVKSDLGAKDEETPNDHYVDSDSSSEEETSVPEEEERQTNNPKKLQEIEMVKHQIKEGKKKYKLWRKQKEKTYFGSCQVCIDDNLNRCQSHFGWIMFLLFVASIVFMFYIKLGQETFSVQDENVSIDYYSILGAEKTATWAEIKKAHRKAVIKWHPDRNRNCGQECIDKMNEVTEAYIILANPETRAFHDRFGVKPPQNLVDMAKAKHGGRGAMKE